MTLKKRHELNHKIPLTVLKYLKNNGQNLFEKSNKIFLTKLLRNVRFLSKPFIDRRTK